MHNYGIDHFEVKRQLSDVLHCQALGTDQRYIGYVLYHASIANVFQFTSTGDDMLHDSVKRLATELKEHYKIQHRLNPERKQSKIDKLTLNMLGAKLRPCLAAKGGETVDALPFAVDIARKHAATSHKMELLAMSGLALLEVKRIQADYSKQVPYSEQRKYIHAAIKHVVTYQAAGGHMVPKHHELLHLCKGVAYNGNPSSYATWWDEHENGLVAKICTSVHSSLFVSAVFERILVGEMQATNR